MSNGRISINIELEGFEEFADAMAKMPKVLMHNLSKELGYVALTAERLARQLAPRDTGELEDSIHAGAIKREGGALVTYIGTNMEYAKYVHELSSNRIGDKYDKGVKITGYYVDGRGQRTRDKPSIKGYKPGRKYLRNAIVLTEPYLEKAMNRAIEKTLGGV